MGTFSRVVAASLLISASAARAEALATGYLGPLGYKSLADTPFETSYFGYCVETFEDGSFDVPGATINGSIVDPGGITDSVDGDDGAIDGSGTGGHSWFYGSGSDGIVVEFPKTRANGLPTEVGIVWTDGGAGDQVWFEAFDSEGNSKGTLLGNTADGSYSGTTGEDQFFGVTDANGITKIRVWNQSGGIEVDHLQLDRCIRCGDADLDFRIVASDALTALKTSVGSDSCLACACDTNSNGSISASDALAILKKSVGLAPTLACPSCDL